MTGLAFLERLKDGGQIVSTGDCSEIEIAVAFACHRVFVNEDGFGFLYRPSAKNLTTENQALREALIEAKKSIGSLNDQIIRLRRGYE